MEAVNAWCAVARCADRTSQSSERGQSRQGRLLTITWPTNLFEVDKSFTFRHATSCNEREIGFSHFSPMAKRRMHEAAWAEEGTQDVAREDVLETFLGS